MTCSMSFMRIALGCARRRPAICGKHTSRSSPQASPVTYRIPIASYQIVPLFPRQQYAFQAVPFRVKYTLNMSHRRRKKKVITPQPPGPGVTTAVASDPRAPSPSQQKAFKAVFENGDRKGYGLENGDMKAVSLRWRTEFYREIVRKKIHDKAAREGALAVVLLTDARSPTRSANFLQRGTFLLSGATLRANAGASVAYTLDEQSRFFSFSEIEWLDEPVGDFFLAGIFPMR